MALTFSRTGPAIGDPDLDAFETRRGVSLPRRYRELLKLHNGGEVSPAGFRVRGDGDSAVVELFAIGSQHLDDAWDTLKWPSCPEIPADYIPIGYCITGDYLCMAVAGPDAGQIRYWNHEECVDEDETPTAEMLYFVADDIDAFLAALHGE